MSCNWQKVRLGDICLLNYGKGLTATKRIAGDIPVYSSAGITGSHNECLIDSKGIIVGRKGTVGSVYFSEVPFFCIDTAYYILPNDDKYNFKYLYYRLKSLNLDKLNEDSAVPGLNRVTAYNQEFSLPPLAEQERIAAILGSLDDKIELNNRINKNLEEQAQALFKRWFVDFEFPDENGQPYKSSGGAMKESELGEIPEDWTVGKLEDYVTIKRGGSPRPIHDFLSNEGLRWLKISDVSTLNTPFIFDIKECIKENGISRTVLLNKGSLVLSNSATPGIPKILAVDSCIHDGWLYFTNSILSNEFLYLLFIEIKPLLLSQGNGSVFTNLKTDIIKSHLLAMANNDIIEYFNVVIKPIFNKILNTTAENQTLASLRDSLLPKLMNNQINL